MKTHINMGPKTDFHLRILSLVLDVSAKELSYRF